jgi:3-methyladenine DNA glycosylase Tag
MKSFKTIYARAAKRHGGETHVEAELPSPSSKASVTRRKDDRYLAEMTRVIFQAGFVWRVINQKWDGFEAAFGGFDPKAWARATPLDLADLEADARIVRNPQKIRTVPKNAQLILDLAKEHGSFGKFLSGWPEDDLVGLYLLLKKRGSRLGGNSAQRFVRNMGKDTFMLTGSVVAALKDAGVVEKAPTSQRDLKATQEAFNTWAQESGRPYCQVSKVLALSIDG